MSLRYIFLSVCIVFIAHTVRAQTSQPLKAELGQGVSIQHSNPELTPAQKIAAEAIHRASVPIPNDLKPGEAFMTGVSSDPNVPPMGWRVKMRTETEQAATKNVPSLKLSEPLKVNIVPASESAK